MEFPIEYVLFYLFTTTWLAIMALIINVSQLERRVKELENKNV